MSTCTICQNQADYAYVANTLRIKISSSMQFDDGSSSSTQTSSNPTTVAVPFCNECINNKKSKYKKIIESILKHDILNYEKYKDYLKDFGELKYHGLNKMEEYSEHFHKLVGF